MLSGRLAFSAQQGACFMPPRHVEGDDLSSGVNSGVGAPRARYGDLLLRHLPERGFDRPWIVGVSPAWRWKPK